MNILITGGSGFLGRQLTVDLAKRYPQAKLRLLDRNEETVRMLLDAINCASIETIIGDIRDKDVVKHAISDVDIIFHLAAMKHVDFCESNVLEAVSINVGGTINLLNFSTGQTFIAMSTDKAVNPSGCYGVTKYLMERLVLERANWDKSRRYMIIRSGNILASSGSVIAKWKRQLKLQNKITVTDPTMTRYFITVQELSAHMLHVLEEGDNGCIYIPSIKSICISDLAEAVIKLYGISNSRIEYTGLRPNEKIHEQLFIDNETVILRKLPDEYSHNRRLWFHRHEPGEISLR